jgi:DNA polymerase-4
MRHSHFQTRGVHLAVLYENYQYFHQGLSLPQAIFSSQDIYRIAYKILRQSPYRFGVRNLAVSCFNLSLRSNVQLELFADTLKKDQLTTAIDEINTRWGNFVISPALMAHTQNHVHDRIGFGQIRDLSN